MNERIKKLRKQLNLSQEKFGTKLGVTKSAISRMELGTYNITDTMLKLIESNFNVNEEWLRNGTGEMFKPTTNDKLQQLSHEYNLSKLEETFFRSYLNLDSKKREAVCEFFENILSLSLPNDFFLAREEVAATTRIENEIESYRQELIAEQKGEISLVSEKPKEA